MKRAKRNTDVLPFEDTAKGTGRLEPRPLPGPAVERKRQRSNRDKVLSFLLARGLATNVELREVGGMRAMARVHELQRLGHPIYTKRRQGGLWDVLYRKTT